MQSLRDKARELVGLAEGAIQQKEATILALRKELEKAKGEVAAGKDQRRAVRSEKCKGCIYKLTALRSLDEESKGEEGDKEAKGVGR